MTNVSLIVEVSFMSYLVIFISYKTVYIILLTLAVQGFEIKAGKLMFWPVCTHLAYACLCVPLSYLV